MGTYVYRVTAKQVTCSDGKKANVAVFAYKPYFGWDGDKLNSKMHFRSGATSSDRMAKNGRLTDRFVFGDENGVPYKDATVYFNRFNVGSFHDGGELAKVENVTL